MANKNCQAKVFDKVGQLNSDIESVIDSDRIHSNFLLHITWWGAGGGIQTEFCNVYMCVCVCV